MEPKEMLYTLQDMKNKISSEEYDKMIKLLAQKVKNYYESTKVALNELDKPIDEIETKHPDLDEEIKQKTIEKMQCMKFTMQSLYQSGSVQIEAVDDEIKFKTYANIYRQKQKKNLADEVIRTVNEVKEELAKLNNDIEK